MSKFEDRPADFIHLDLTGFVAQMVIDSMAEKIELVTDQLRVSEVEHEEEVHARGVAENYYRDAIKMFLDKNYHGTAERFWDGILHGVPLIHLTSNSLLVPMPFTEDGMYPTKVEEVIDINREVTRFREAIDSASVQEIPKSKVSKGIDVLIAFHARERYGFPEFMDGVTYQHIDGSTWHSQVYNGFEKWDRELIERNIVDLKDAVTFGFPNVFEGGAKEGDIHEGPNGSFWLLSKTPNQRLFWKNVTILRNSLDVVAILPEDIAFKHYAFPEWEAGKVVVRPENNSDWRTKIINGKKFWERYITDVDDSDVKVTDDV